MRDTDTWRLSVQEKLSILPTRTVKFEKVDSSVVERLGATSETMYGYVFAHLVEPLELTAWWVGPRKIQGREVDVKGWAKCSQIVPIRHVTLARFQMRLLPKTTTSAI